MTYTIDSKQTSLKKEVLSLIYPSEKIKIWTLHSGFVYKKSVNFLVVNVKEDETDLVEASSTSLGQGEFYYNAGFVYVRMSDNSNPLTKFVSVTYKIGFSVSGIKFPHDLSTGHDIEFYPLINSVSDFPFGLDAEQLGISIESNGSINFTMDDFWYTYFDTLVWNKKTILIYSLLGNNTKKIFEGEIKEKRFGNRVSFSISDNVYKLRQPISGTLYDSSDGDISENRIGRPKRTLYGRVKGNRLVSLKKVLDGYQLTGTVSLTENSVNVVGSGTQFLKELSPNDEIIFVFNEVEYSYRINTISSDTACTLSEESDLSVSGQDINVRPEISYRYKNREFLIAGHKLREPTTTVTGVIQLNRIQVADVTDFLVNDTIIIGSETKQIKRIINNVLVLRTNLAANPSIGETVTKNPIENVYFDNRSYIIDRDWTLTQNNTSGAKITLEDDAEFNVTSPSIVSGSVDFVNGSRDVTGTGTLFTQQFNSRDWIVSDDANHQVWYEILQVTDDTHLTLRIAYAGDNDTSTNTKRKNINYISDDSIITCDCIGKENANGEWVKTGSDVVKDILTSVGISNLNNQSFIDAAIEAPQIISLKLPLDIDDSLPTVREVINLVNQSVFGSLVQRSDFTFAYDILSAERPQNTDDSIRKDDLSANPTIETNSNIYKKVIVRYLHQDNEKTSGESSSSIEEFENDFVANMIDTDEELKKDIYVYGSNDAQTMAQRYGYFHSMSQSIISLSGGGLTLSDRQLNDKVYIENEKLFVRFGGSDRSKVAIINSIVQNGQEYNIKCNDLGNWFNRTAAITPNDANIFIESTSKELILNGYIVDNNTELPDNNYEERLNTNLIG